MVSLENFQPEIVKEKWIKVFFLEPIYGKRYVTQLWEFGPIAQLVRAADS